MTCIPRPAPKGLNKLERLKTPWDFLKSIFKDYKPDTDVLLLNCFEFDWSNTKIEKLVKDESEIEITKEFLKSHYKCIRETYKYYAAVAPAGHVFSIGTNVFSDILSNCPGAVDGKTLKISDLDLEFVSTNASIKKSNPRNPER